VLVDIIYEEYETLQLHYDENQVENNNSYFHEIKN